MLTNNEKIQQAYMMVCEAIENLELDFTKMLSDDDIDPPIRLLSILQFAKDKIESEIRKYDH